VTSSVKSSCRPHLFVFGDTDGSITQVLTTIRVKGGLPYNLKILNVDGCQEKTPNHPVDDKKPVKTTGPCVQGDVTWPLVESYQ
jgi:hypothetical protein